MTGHRFLGALGEGENVRVLDVHHEPLGHANLVVEVWTCGHGEFMKTTRKNFNPKSAMKRVGKLRRCAWCKDPAADDPPQLDLFHEHGLFLDR